MPSPARSGRRRSLRSWLRICLRRNQTDALMYGVAAVVTLVSVARPFWAATYPPMTDLPFHAAQTSIFAHYFDPSYHFREQFELAPLGVPYVSSYVLGAFLMLFLPVVAAVKTATAIMLLAVPVGLGVLAWGMRKTPLLGLSGLPFVWCNLTHWGFINFVSALGMFAASLGLAIRVLDRPSRRARIALALCLVLLFFTHVFRFPFAIAAIAAATGLLYPITKRVTPILLPVAPSVLLFLVFLAVRPAAVDARVQLGFEPKRLATFFDVIAGSFHDPDEAAVAVRHLVVMGVVAAVSLGYALATIGKRERARLWFSAACAGIVVGCILACGIAFVTLPIKIGIWWYVYPREATAALYLAMALVPNLPRAPWLRAAAVTAMSWSALSVTGVVARNYAAFDRSTRDFTAISESVPKAPRLLYLVFDHDGSTRTTTPFLHLPAYIQAEKGGFLSFHFAMWGSSPVRYRTGPDAVVPPPVPDRWEWQPHLFDVRRNGAFFDWFLVRSASDPGGLFRADKTIHEVRHEGTWWLYARDPEI